MDDIINFFSKFGISFAGTYVFDIVNGLSSTKSMTDAALLAFSFSLSDLVVNNVMKGWQVFNVGDHSQKWLNERIISPLISALLYDYLYNTFYKEKFAAMSEDNHTRNENYILGFVISNLTNMVNAPALSLLGVKQFN